MASPPPELCFGLELEFLAPPSLGPRPQLLSKLSPHLYCDLEAERCFYYLADALQTAGFPAAYQRTLRQDECDDEPSRPSAPPDCLLGNLRVMDPRNVAPARRGLGQFAFWLLKAEHDLRVSSRYKAWLEAELNTPILHESEAVNGFPTLNRAMQTLRQAHPHGLHVSSRCGLHIHVSPVDGLTAEHIQRLGTLFFLIDHHLLFRLCSSHRRLCHATTAAAARFAISPDYLRPEEEERAGQMADFLPDPLLRLHNAKMKQLWSAHDVSAAAGRLDGVMDDLCRLPCALGVSHHWLPDGSASYSLEFRHAQSSLSKTFVNHWTGLLLTITKTAFLPRPRFKDMLEQLWDVVADDPDPDLAWKPLLQILLQNAPTEWAYQIDLEYWSRHVQEPPSSESPDPRPDERVAEGA